MVLSGYLGADEAPRIRREKLRSYEARYLRPVVRCPGGEGQGGNFVPVLSLLFGYETTRTDTK